MHDNANHHKFSIDPHTMGGLVVCWAGGGTGEEEFEREQLFDHEKKLFHRIETCSFI